MESYKFRLKESQKGITPSNQTETTVFLFFSYGYYETTSTGKKKYKPLKISTGLKIYPHLWNATKQQMKVNSLKNYDEFNQEIEAFLNKVKTAYKENTNIDPKSLKNKILSDKTRTERPKNLLNYIDTYISDIESGKRTTAHSAKPFSQGVVKIFKTFRNVFFEFKNLYPLRRFDFADINMSFYKDYVSFLENVKKYKTNTKGRHIKNLKMIMKAALDEGLHTEIGFQDKGFKVLREDVNMMYLTEAEIEAIRTVDLSNEPNLEDSRAVFLAGCYTAQRFSDYHRISEKHIKNGFIYLKQVKTGTEVIIPIHHKLKAILSKYKNNLPYVYDQKLNLDIKAIALKAKIKNYHQITSHTARRSGATNMYLAGLKTIEIMKITGHKTESEFLKYIKITKEETAKSLANHPYYKGE